MYMDVRSKISIFVNLLLLFPVKKVVIGEEELRGIDIDGILNL